MEKLKYCYELQHLGQRLFQHHAGREFFEVAIGELARHNYLSLRNMLPYFGNEFFKIKIAGYAGKMGIQVIGLLAIDDKFKIVKGNIGAQVNNLYAATFKQVIGVQQAQLVIFSFGQKKNY